MTEKSTAGRGALARLIATRGGRAAPEAPFVIEHREALIYMLCEAAELEHAIMCQYLFAAFSLKQSTDEGLTASQLRAVERWRKTVSHIATQEMLHLALVQNLLSAVGAAPHLERPNLPQPAGHYPPGVILTLLPFGEAALRHFMFLERPEGMDLADAPGLDAVERAAPVMQDGDIVPRLQDFATVGHLYRSIEEGIKHLCAKYGERWLFVGPAEAQASEKHFGWPGLVQVVDAGSAQRAIDTILEQGEGPRGHWRRAHFGSFVDVCDEYQRLRNADPDFEPARPVLPATVRPSEGDHRTPLIEDPYTARCADLFNVSYEVLLQTLARYFAHTEETGPQLGTLAQVTLGLMFNVIKPLGQLITTLPVGGSHPDRVAGPSFELFYDSDYLLPHRDSAWALMEERLREAAAFADRLCHDGTPDVAGRVHPIGSALLELGHTLATGRAEWGGHDHAGEVTVAHHRRDAETARTNPEVAAGVDRLAATLRTALRIEQSQALRALLAAASTDATNDERDGTRRARKRSLFTESDRHFQRTVDLAELLVGVAGESEIEAADLSSALEGDRSPDLIATYAELNSRLLDVPSEALLVDPRPAPTFRPEEQRHPLPGIVDRQSALALIAHITEGQATAPDVDGRLPVGTRQVGDLRVDPALTGSVAQLFGDAHLALLAVLGSTVGGESDVVAARHRLREISARLRTRVLRPLAEALCQLTVDPAAALIEADYRHGRPDRAIKVEDRLRTLAIVATGIRAGLETALPEVLEATAALQDLVLTFAAASGADQTALLERFRAAEAALPGSIQLVRNGPYVLTNVDQLTDGLGDPICARPQMALCRCGQSGAKPWCDGSHALADFDDAKDPNRVADRRDTYRGLSLTVYDNRGICQHSGYCTDRLPLAFRVDQEPFVAPSGARMDEIVRAVRNCPSGALSYAIDNHEARSDVDWHHQRSAAVAVTADGPYRVVGALPLIDCSGAPVARNQGVSVEHYALCRCGHSQNKPFCSGMHWYIRFRDPVPDPDHTPTLYEWCGGISALARMTRLFFERYVPEDPLLAPLFANAPAEQPERMAAWFGEVLGGPPCGEDRAGDAAELLGAPVTRPFDEPERARWVSLLLRSAQEAGLPTDAEFWSALTAYINWESRQLAHYAQGDIPRPPGRQPWGWGPAGPPKTSPQPAAETESSEAAIPGPDEPVGFATHIQPLFRAGDRQSMSFAFDLWSYDQVKQHAAVIVDRLRAGNMPCDGPWPQQKTELFQRWMDEGTQP
jgi:CDGSH-type Zn-finger protein/truncated hemoglobin YjbI